MRMDTNTKERYVRWQNYRITQFSFAINLFLGFAIASLAFAMNAKFDRKAIPVEVLNVTIVWWGISVLAGVLATLVRLLDFRYTAQKIMHGGAFNEFMARYCGPITWSIFWIQVGSYALGAYLFVMGALAP